MPTQSTPIDLYLASVPAHFKPILEHLRKVIKEVVPDADESITYQIPTFKHKGKAVGGFGAFTNHCSFFPFSGGLLGDFKVELTGYDQTKSAVHFTPEKPVPDEVIKKMIEAKMLFNAKKK